MQTTLLKEPTMLLLPAGHRLARRRIVDLEEVADDRWITRSSHPVASVLERICRDAGFDPDIVFEANDYPELLGMVSAGLGVAVAPRLAVRAHGPDVRVVAIRGNPAPRRILLAKLAERVQSPATLALVRSFRTVSAAKEWRG
ncbi:LysR family transcriptional regulator [Mycobacteroides abscessus subsp. abscessus]|nr:LysR family transcriptional regulator [Mycobacteroides abscessus subsp. abscessus]